MISAFGKVILVGEHAVVYGHPALAGAVDSGLRCRIEARPSGPLALRVPAWDLSVRAGDDHAVAVALTAVAERMNARDLAAEITVESPVPPRAGLGSSAALAVAVTRAIALSRDEALDDAEVEAIADAAERCFHENPSGVDVALATRGGLGLFRRGEGLEPIAAEPVTLVVGLSGVPRRTADMVARVAASREARGAEGEAALASLGEAAEHAARAVALGNYAAVGAIMSRAHETLAGFGISIPELDELVSTALEAGALGAKLTGAGGGGAVIALAPEREIHVLEAWQARGYECFPCKVGATRPPAGDEDDAR